MLLARAGRWARAAGPAIDASPSKRYPRRAPTWNGVNRIGATRISRSRARAAPACARAPPTWASCDADTNTPRANWTRPRTRAQAADPSEFPSLAQVRTLFTWRIHDRPPSTNRVRPVEQQGRPEGGSRTRCRLAPPQLNLLPTGLATSERLRPSMIADKEAIRSLLASRTCWN